MLLLGDPQQAEFHYRAALARIAPSFPRDRLSQLSRLALARVQLRATRRRVLGDDHPRTLESARNLAADRSPRSRSMP